MHNSYIGFRPVAASWSPMKSNIPWPQIEQAADEAPQPIYLVGLSVGQGTQPSAIAIVEKSGKQPALQHKCRYLRRLRHTSYPALQELLQDVFRKPALAGGELVVEAGTSLSAIVGFLRRIQLGARMHAVEVKTGGVQGRSDKTWKVSKGTLIETTRQIMQEGRLVFDDKMPKEIRATTPPVHAIYQTLLHYPASQGPVANDAFAAREGEYDDLVLAVTLACWYGERCQRTFAMLRS